MPLNLLYIFMPMIFLINCYLNSKALSKKIIISEQNCNSFLCPKIEHHNSHKEKVYSVRNTYKIHIDLSFPQGSHLFTLNIPFINLVIQWTLEKRNIFLFNQIPLLTFQNLCSTKHYDIEFIRNILTPFLYS